MNFTAVKYHHSLRNICYRRNGILDVQKLKEELRKPKPFDDDDELAATLIPSWTTLFWASFMIIGAIGLLLWFFGSLVLKSLAAFYPFKGDTSWFSIFISTVTNDWHYFVAVPMSLPIFMWLIYFNWLFFNFFQHN
jgi:hypothetical protein